MRSINDQPVDFSRETTRSAGRMRLERRADLASRTSRLDSGGSSASRPRSKIVVQSVLLRNELMSPVSRYSALRVVAVSLLSLFTGYSAFAPTSLKAVSVVLHDRTGERGVSVRASTTSDGTGQMDAILELDPHVGHECDNAVRSNSTPPKSEWNRPTAPASSTPRRTSRRLSSTHSTSSSPSRSGEFRDCRRESASPVVSRRT